MRVGALRRLRICETLPGTDPNCCCQLWHLICKSYCLSCARVYSAFGGEVSQFDDKFASTPVCGLVPSGLLEQVKNMRVRVSSRL